MSTLDFKSSLWIIINQGSAAAHQLRLGLKFKTRLDTFPYSMSGLDLQLVFKIVKGWFQWGLQLADARLPSPVINFSFHSISQHIQNYLGICWSFIPKKCCLFILNLSFFVYIILNLKLTRKHCF